MSDHALLGVSEAARRLKVHTHTLRRWDLSGKLPAVKDSAGRRLYTPAQVEAFRRQREGIAPLHEGE